MHAFLYGVFLALGLIVPLGVQNIFIFNQGASQRHFLQAIPSVLTAIVCDSILIIASVLGVSVVLLAIPWLKKTILLMGFCFLIYMGWVTWYSKPMALQPGKQPLSAGKQLIFSASVSLLNPHAMLDTIGVIGTSSLQFIGRDKWMFTFGCVFISSVWFFMLSVMGHFLHRLDKTGKALRIMNQCSAIMVWSVAVYIGWLFVQACLH